MKNILFLSITFFLFSCTNGFDSPKNEELFDHVISFEYNDTKYNALYKLNDDSSFVFKDIKIQQLIEELTELPELSIFMNEDGSYVFHDTYEDFLNSSKKNDNNMTRNAPNYAGANVRLYEHTFLSGKVLSLSLKDSETKAEYTNLVNYNFNDIISSLILTNNSNTKVVSITLWVDKDFKGKSISFAAPRLGSNTVPKMSEYKVKDGILGIGKKSWNDEASSVRIFWNN